MLPVLPDMNAYAYVGNAPLRLVDPQCWRVLASMTVSAGELASFDTMRALTPDPVIEAYKKDVDRTLLRSNLKRTAEERIDAAIAWQRFAEDLRAAMREAKGRRDETR